MKVDLQKKDILHKQKIEIELMIHAFEIQKNKNKLDQYYMKEKEKI